MNRMQANLLRNDDCKNQINSLELPYKHIATNNFFNCNKDNISVKIKSEVEFDNIKKNFLNQSYKQEKSNDCREKVTGVEIKKENEFDCNNLKKNPLNLNYKQDTPNDCREKVIGVEIKKEYEVDCSEGDSLEINYTQDVPNDSKKKINENDCKEKNSNVSSMNCYTSDNDTGDKEMLNPLSLSDIYDPSSVAFSSKINIHSKYPSGSNDNTFPTIKCDLCDASFKSRKRYKTHLENHPLNEKVKCNMCGKSFPYNRFLRHITVHTGEKPHVCEICERAFRLKRDLKQHSFTHTGERPYQCKMCEKKFADSSARRKHYQTHTGEKPYTCEICQRAFTQISHLREHQVTHTREKGHICDMCAKKFTTKSSLQRHVLTHLNCCEICGETFTTSTKLGRHKELHDSSRQYSCPFCTRRFVKKTDLNTHVMIHSEVKDVLCTICNGAFKSYRYLRVHHYHYHTGMEPPFACPVCKKGFFQEMSLKKHSVAHLPKKRVKCFQCKKVFATPEVLEGHNCVLDSYFSCEFCDRKYRHKSDLNKHVRKFHKK